MSRDEFLKAMTAIWVEFPQRENKREHAATWFRTFGNEDADLFFQAVQRCLLSNRFEPKLADVAEALFELKSDQVPAIAAWEKLTRTIRSFGRYREDEGLAALPAPIRRVAQGLGWQEICNSEQPEVLRAQFERNYNALLKRERIEATAALIAPMAKLSTAKQNAIEELEGK